MGGIFVVIEGDNKLIGGGIKCFDQRVLSDVLYRFVFVFLSEETGYFLEEFFTGLIMEVQ